MSSNEKHHEVNQHCIGWFKTKSIVCHFVAYFKSGWVQLLESLLPKS
jgi:hypothetical protein